MKQEIAANRETAFRNRRRDWRIDLDAIAEISIDGRPRECRIVNISSAGALLESRAIPALGSVVHLSVPGIGPTSATVARATSTYYAVTFVSPIDVAALST